MNSWLDVPLNVLTVAPTVDEDELLLDDMMSVAVKCRFSEVF